jgi:hypothetical protein
MTRLRYHDDPGFFAPRREVNLVLCARGLPLFGGGELQGQPRKERR